MHGTISCRLKHTLSPPLVLHRSDRLIVMVSLVGAALVGAALVGAALVGAALVGAALGNLFMIFVGCESIIGLLLGLSRHCFSWYQQLFLAV
jgi:hypothetical protein